MALKTRFLGICPVCQREFKLIEEGYPDGSADPMGMVHHGYQRPGVGYIVGDCFGVGYAAYQLTNQGCIEYRTAVEGQMARAEKLLAEIDSGETRTAWVERRVAFGTSEMVKVTSEEPKFADALKVYRKMTEYEIRSCKGEIERMDKLILNWTLQAVRTVEEAIREVDTQKAARKAEREAKREAARVKTAERVELVKKREAERQALIAKYKAVFETLAAGVESTKDRKHQARWDWVEMYKVMGKRAYMHFYPRALGCDEALFAGSRKWLSPKLIDRAMATLPPGSIVVSGGAPGVDNIAADCARARGFEVRVYPALAHGRKWPSAGPLRNQEMLDKEHPTKEGELIDAAFLFHEDPGLGKGTRDMKARLDAAVPPIKITVEIGKGR